MIDRHWLHHLLLRPWICKYKSYTFLHSCLATLHMRTTKPARPPKQMADMLSHAFAYTARSTCTMLHKTVLQAAGGIHASTITYAVTRVRSAEVLCITFPGSPSGEVAQKIDEAFGSLDEFKKQFSTAGATQFGSGWAWLVKNSDGKLSIEKTPNAQTPFHLQGQVRKVLQRMLRLLSHCCSGMHSTQYQWCWFLLTNSGALCRLLC